MNKKNALRARDKKDYFELGEFRTSNLYIELRSEVECQ